MTTIKKIKSDINENINYAQMKTDAVRVQLALGKTEFNDHIIAKQIEASNAAEELSKHLMNIGVSAGEIQNDIISNVDNLRLQVELGKMEGKTAIEQFTSEQAKYSEKFEKSIEKVKKIEQEKIQEVKVKVLDYLTKISNFKANIAAKVDTLAV